jgi:hypothetical protein
MLITPQHPLVGIPLLLLFCMPFLSRLQRTGPPGVFIVLSGLVTVELVRCKQHTTHFVGVGGSVGYLSSLLGRDLPGVALVAAFAQVRFTPVKIQLLHLH